jgi:hypothetical protein
LEEAFELLEQHITQKNLRNAVTIQRSNFNEIQSEKLKDDMPWEALQTKKDRLRNALLELVNQLEVQAPPAEPKADESGSKTGNRHITMGSGGTYIEKLEGEYNNYKSKEE